MFGPKLDSKSYTTFLLIVIGVLLSLNLFAQIEVPIRDPAREERYDSTAAQRDVAASSQAIAAATDRVAAANMAIAQALESIANAIDAKSEFEVNVTMPENGAATTATPAPPAADGEEPADEPELGSIRLR